MSRLPWIVGGGALAAYLWTRTIKPHTSSSPTASSTTPPKPTPASLPGRWVWPMAAWRGRKPVVSDGFDSPRPGFPRHGAVDLMFPRLATDAYKAGTPNGSARHVMPDGIQALAASDGVVWSAMQTPRGYAVVISHAPRGAMTFYTHLDHLLVAATGPDKPKQRVAAGQPIGTIGFDPTDPAKLKHLHFEVWIGTGASDRVDPEPLMRSWQVLDAPTGQLVARNARKDHPDTVRVVAHTRSWPGTSLRARH